jgi:S1-C subfamily serine protease
VAFLEFGTRSTHVLSPVIVALLLAIAGHTPAQTVPATGSGPSDARGEAEALPQAVPPAAVASIAGRVILDRVRPAMIQIKGFFGTNTAEAFHGSGFAVARGGVFITNWHVVSEAVLYPEKYRLEYRTAAGATGRVTVRAIDLRHDLALVETHGFAPPPLSLRSDVAIRGERAYSVGFPLDVGLTITEGISNGRVEDSFEARVHYSGALNAGMSGGPGLDGSGNVIGVNVAGYRASQLVAFLVPAEHAVSLLARADRPPLDTRHARAEIASQVRAHSEALLAAIGTKLPTQNHHGYELPGKPAAFVECRAGGDPAPDQPVNVERIVCDAKSSVYLGRNLHPGVPASGPEQPHARPLALRAPDAESEVGVRRLRLCPAARAVRLQAAQCGAERLHGERDRLPARVPQARRDLRPPRARREQERAQTGLSVEPESHRSRP